MSNKQFITPHASSPGSSGGGGSGTVTSVTFTGDGVTLSTTPSSAVTTSGTLTATAATQSGNVFIASPANGSSGLLAARTIVAADVPTLNQNTSGTASNLSGTPALPNGTTATTQAASDNSTKLATTAYADAGSPRVTASPNYETLPWGSGALIAEPGIAAGMDGTTNRCRFAIFTLFDTLVITTMSINISTSANGQKVFIGIYDSANTTLKGQWTFTLTAATGIYSATKVGGGSLTLTPGAYMYVWASDSATPVASGYNPAGGTGNIFGSLLNKNATRIGQGAVGSVVSSGTMPANLGTLAATAVVNPPGAFCEP